MKILACIPFFAASYATENDNSKPGCNDCKNDVAIDIEDLKKQQGDLRSYSIETITTDDVEIDVEDLEKQQGNLRSYSIEKITTGDIVIEDFTVRKSKHMALEEIFTKKHCLRELLSYLENADQVAILNTCKSLKKLVLTSYKESIRNCPENRAYDRILCLSAIDFSFQRALREEIAESPRWFTKLRDDVKAQVQRMPNDGYIENHGLQIRIYSGTELTELTEYEKLSKKGIEIINAALLQVRDYDLERQEAASRIKRRFVDRCFCFPVLLMIFGLYMAFLISPLDSLANFTVHSILTIVSGATVFFFAVFDWGFWDEEGSFYALIPEKFFRLYIGFSAVTFAAVASRWFAGRSFVTYILAAIFIGLFYFLPLIFLVPRKVYRDYFSKQVEPVEIRKAKKTIQNIQRFFFVDN